MADHDHDYLSTKGPGEIRRGPLSGLQHIFATPDQGPGKADQSPVAPDSTLESEAEIRELRKALSAAIGYIVNRNGDMDDIAMRVYEQGRAALALRPKP